MNSCCAKNCVNHESRAAEERITEGVSYHFFPKKPELKEKWLKQLNQDDFEPDESSSLCSLHFIKEYFLTDARGVSHLKADAVPTEFEFDLTMEATGDIEGSDTIRCCAYKCTNTYQEDSPITFHAFPVDNAELCDQWLMAMNVTQVAATSAVLCSEHFDETCFVTGDDGQRLIIADAVPSIFLYPQGNEENNIDAIEESMANLHSDSMENGDAGESMILSEEALELVNKHDSVVIAMNEESQRLMDLVKQRKALEKERNDLDVLLRIVLNGGPLDRVRLRGLGPLIRGIDEIAQQVVVDCLAPCITLPQEIKE